MRQILRHILFSCFIILVFNGCNSGRNEAKNKQVFHLNLASGNLESIDPAFAKELYSMWSIHMVYNTLFETNEQLQLVPSLAKSYERSIDGLLYTIRLRTDVFFQDDPAFANGKGRKMIASDVVYSFNRIADPKVASPGAWIFNDRIADKDPFVVINDSTLEIRLKKPFGPLPQILSMPYCSVVPKECTEKWGKDFRSHPCGTGPFQFDYWDEGNVLVLHRNEHYWERDSNGKQLPYLDAVQLSFVDSKASEFLMFMQGKLDFVNSVDGSFKDLLLSKDGSLKNEYRDQFDLSISTYLDNEYIGFLTDQNSPVIKDNPIRNKLVRQAINYAIDRKKIVRYFRNGVAVPATSGFIPPGMPGHDSSGSFGYDYDPQKALQLLAQAGYPNGKGMPPIKITSPDNFLDIVNFIVTELQDIGIPATAEAMQPNILRSQMARSQSPAFRATWIADYPDAETFLCVFNSQLPAPPNYTRFHNDAFDALYESSMKEPDSIRWKHYREMDSLAMRDAPVLHIYYDRLLHFTRKNVKGFTSNPMNLIDVKRVQISPKS